MSTYHDKISEMEDKDGVLEALAASRTLRKEYNPWNSTDVVQLSQGA